MSFWYLQLPTPSFLVAWKQPTRRRVAHALLVLAKVPVFCPIGHTHGHAMLWRGTADVNMTFGCLRIGLSWMPRAV